MATSISLTPAEKKTIEGVLTQRNEVGKIISKVTIVNTDKKKKPEDKIFILGNNRVFFFKEKGKLEEDYHLLDCIEVNSPSESEISMKFKNQNTVKFTTTDTGDILKSFYTTLVTTFPGITIGKAIIFTVLPESRLISIFQTASALKDSGGCGSFASTYKSICDYIGATPLQSILWDVENLLPFNSVKELNLNEVFGLGPSDLKPILMSLSYNTYFQSFVANNCKLSSDDINHLSESLKINTTIQRLHLHNIQASKESIMQLLTVLSENKSIKVNTINISNNILETKGVVTLGAAIQSFSTGLTYLNLSDTGASVKGLEALFTSLVASPTASTLTYLNIANNKLEQLGTVALCKFLTKSIHLQTLNMSNTLPVFNQLRTGCPSLETLDFSGNRPSSSKEGIVELLSFFKQMPKLKDINLARIGIGGDDLKILFSPATSLLKCPNVDLSDNELGDEGILKLCEVMYPNSSLRHLAIDNNFKNRSKQRSRAIEAICNLIEDNNNIESLSIANTISGKGLKTDLVPLILSLLKNQSLLKLDMSGNGSGDAGALALVKVLWRNETLRSLKIDGNDFTFTAYKMIKNSIKRNPKSITMLSMPLGDINSMLASDKANGSEKIHKTLAELQNSITHNIPLQANTNNAGGDAPAQPKPSPRKLPGIPPSVVGGKPAPSPSPSANSTLPIKRPIRGPLYPGRTTVDKPGLGGGSAVPAAASDIPLIVSRSVDYLIAKGLKSVGLFRTCASANLLKKVKARFEAGEDIDLAGEGVDYDTAAGVLKSYFRELPVPIFPEQLHPKFFQASQLGSLADKTSAYRDIMENQLAPKESKMVKKLFLLLHQVSLEKEENMMSAENIAICWAPTLFRSFASELLPINAFLMVHYYEIFDPENAPKPPAAPAAAATPTTPTSSTPVKSGLGSSGGINRLSANLPGQRLSLGSAAGNRLSGTYSDTSSNSAGSDSHSSTPNQSPPGSPILDGTATLKKRFSRVSRISYSPVLPRAAWGESSRTISSLFQEDDLQPIDPTA